MGYDEDEKEEPFDFKTAFPYLYHKQQQRFKNSIMN